MSSGGGKGGGGSTSTPEGRQLAGTAGRFEKESRPVRNLYLNQLAGILSGGVDWLGPSMGGRSPGGGTAGAGTAGALGGLGSPTVPRRLTRADVVDAYGLYDPGKTQDVDRLLQGMPEDFTLEELRSGANMGGLSGRSKAAWDQVLGELGSQAPNAMGGGGLGGGAGGSFMLPLAQTAIENSRQSTARNLAALEKQFAGLQGVGANNPFAMNTLAQARITGEQATSQIPSRLIEQFLTTGLPLAFGQGGQALQGLSSAAGNASSLASSNTAAGAGKAAGDAAMYAEIAAAIAKAAATIYTT